MTLPGGTCNEVAICDDRCSSHFARPAPPARSSDEPATKVKALFLTQSKGFVHGSVNRHKETLAPAEIAMTQLGQQTGLYDLHCTQDGAADITKDNLKNYDIVMFYTTGDLPIALRESRLLHQRLAQAEGPRVHGLPLGDRHLS